VDIYTSGNTMPGEISYIRYKPDKDDHASSRHTSSLSVLPPARQDTSLYCLPYFADHAHWMAACRYLGRCRSAEFQG